MGGYHNYKYFLVCELVIGQELKLTIKRFHFAKCMIVIKAKVCIKVIYNLTTASAVAQHTYKAWCHVSFVLNCLICSGKPMTLPSLSTPSPCASANTSRRPWTQTAARDRLAGSGFGVRANNKVRKLLNKVGNTTD